MRLKRNLTFALLGGMTDKNPSAMTAVLRQMILVSHMLAFGEDLQQAIRDWCSGHFISYPEG